MPNVSRPQKLMQPGDDAVSGQVAELGERKLQGWSSIKEFSDELQKWDPRIVYESVRSLPAWRSWVAADQQQQQQQQQQK